MTTTAFPGPLSVEGAKPPITGPTPYIGSPPAIVNENPDFGPSLLWMGIGVRDPRYLQRIGAGANVAGGYPNQDCGWFFAGPGLLLTNQVPSTAAANNVAASQATTVGGTLALAAASTGVTVLAAPLTILSTGKVVPAGCLVLDGTPTYTGSGTSGAFAFFNPGNSLSRALVVAGAGSDVTVRGYDVYGVPMTERIAAASGKKAFKFIQSITGNAVAAGTTVGTLDIFGLQIASAFAAHLRTVWNGTVINTATGFVAAVATTATSTTGDVRGTYAAPDAADNVKRLVIYSALPFGTIANTVAGATTALLGVAQA